jgi:hypothetical protein
MMAFTWQSGKLVAGFQLVHDEKLGTVVFLGEEGRGRYFEKVGLDRRNPAQVVGGRVRSAFPREVVLDAKSGKPEKKFYVLEKARDGWDVLVRVNTYGGYLKQGRGYWSVVSGKPTVLVQGNGAFGDAGRNGNWHDGLIRMLPGDVLRIHPTRSVDGVSEFALWVDEHGDPKTSTWEEFENLKAAAKASVIVAESTMGGKALDVAFRQMPALTYTGGEDWEFGIAFKRGIAGPAVVLGTEGRGQRECQVSLVGMEDDNGTIYGAAVAKLDESDGKAIWGLANVDDCEPDTALVRMRPQGRHRVHIEVRAHRGEPVKLASGNFASGDAGRVDSTPDELWVMRPGDLLAVGTYGNPPSRVVEYTGGKLAILSGKKWEEQDGLANPEAYLAKNRAPRGHVPDGWVGRVVTVESWVSDYDSRNEKVLELREHGKGELVEIGKDFVILNAGWDGRDRRLVRFNSYVWVTDTGELPVAPDPNRVTVQDEARELRERASVLRSAEHFACFAHELQALVKKVAEGRSSESWSDDVADVRLMSTEGIGRWVEWANGVMSKAADAALAATELHRRQTGGKVLANFSAWKRRGGATNCGQGWVISPDGSLRGPDRMDKPRPKYDEGTQHWDLVAEEELALVWSKAYTAAAHDFKVAKLPVGGPTAKQLERAVELQLEIAQQFPVTSTGLSSGLPSPSVGKGWGL